MRLTLLLIILPLLATCQVNSPLLLNLELLSSGFYTDYYKLSIANDQKSTYLKIQIRNNLSHQITEDSIHINKNELEKIDTILNELDLTKDTAGIVYYYSESGADSVRILKFRTGSQMIYIFGKFLIQGKEVSINTQTPITDHSLKLLFLELKRIIRRSEQNKQVLRDLLDQICSITRM